MIANDWPARWAASYPNRIAVTDRARDAAITWGQLDRHAGAIARHLAVEARVGAGDRVAVLAENRIETVETFFAVARLRAVLMPVNVKLALPELVRVFVDAAPKAILFSDEQAAVAKAILAAIADARPTAPPPLLVPIDGPKWHAVASGPRDGVPAEAVVEETDPWLVLYTSGSTGRPKGALVTHRQVLWNAMQTLLACDLGRDDSTITYTPLFYTGGWNVLSTPIWYRGGTVHLMPAFDARAILDCLERERVTTVFGVPTTLAGLAAEPAFPTARLDALRVVLCGGAACSEALLGTYLGRGIRLRPGYGLTEVGPNCLGVRPEDALRKVGSIGRPNLHLEVRITDEEGRPVAAGEEGELRLRGPTVFGGYFGNAEATAAAIDADGFFRTGDVVRADDEGFLYLVGRRNDMFKSGGEKVYAGEVEAAIARHPAVAEVVVFGVPDAKWGEVGRAIVVARPAARIDEETLKTWLQNEIARFKVPKTFALVDALPRTETGKLARVAIKAKYAVLEPEAVAAA